MAPERSEARTGRRFTWRFGLGLGWIAAIAASSLGALVNRPAFADTKVSGAIVLIAISIPAVVLAIAVIRPVGLLLSTSLLSCTASVLGAWSTMRDTSSTAAIGVVATPFMAAFIVLVGCGVAMAWDFANRRWRREAIVVSALAAVARRERDEG